MASGSLGQPINRILRLDWKSSRWFDCLLYMCNVRLRQQKRVRDRKKRKTGFLEAWQWRGVESLSLAYDTEKFPSLLRLDLEISNDLNRRWSTLEEENLHRVKADESLESFNVLCLHLKPSKHNSPESLKALLLLFRRRTGKRRYRKSAFSERMKGIHHQWELSQKLQCCIVSPLTLLRSDACHFPLLNDSEQVLFCIWAHPTFPLSSHHSYCCCATVSFEHLLKHFIVPFCDRLWTWDLLLLVVRSRCRARDGSRRLMRFVRWRFERLVWFGRS